MRLAVSTLLTLLLVATGQVAGEGSPVNRIIMSAPCKKRASDCSKSG